jgi:ubiquinone/menaquinone biosynthesis C-methylase UbiE
MKSQKDVWNNIAGEWYEFKTKPAEHVMEFLGKCSGNVLDFGSGAGRHLVKIKKGKMFLIDFSSEMIELAKKRAKENKIEAEFLVSPMEKISYPDEFFDYAISISALHCIEGEKNREKAVKELYRVLKKGGQAVIGVWNIKSKRFRNAGKEKMVNWRDKGARYYYLYDEREVHDLFRKVGFKIVEERNSEMMINFIVKKN